MPKIQKLPNGQLVLTIPRQLAKLKNWKRGDILSFLEHEKNSFILKKEGNDRDG